MVELIIKLKDDEYNRIVQSDKTGFADFVSKEAMIYAIKDGILISKKYDKTIDEIRNMNQIQVGKIYSMDCFDVMCIKQRKSGLYKMQTLGMTAGPWPGDGDISDYDDVTKSFTREWKGVISKFKLPKLTDKLLDCKGRTYEALVGAAARWKQFGAGYHAWLGTVYGIYSAWCVGSGGSVDNYGGNKNYGYVVAPCFDLDPSKIILDGDEIKRAVFLPHRA